MEHSSFESQRRFGIVTPTKTSDRCDQHQIHVITAIKKKINVLSN